MGERWSQGFVFDGDAMLAECGYSPFQVHGVPERDGGDDQVESAGTVALVLEATVAQVPLAVEEDGAGESVSGFAFVETDLTRVCVAPGLSSIPA